MTTRSVALVVLVAVFGLTVAPLASGAVVTAFAADDGEVESETNASVSTYMHASAADAENTVDAELFAKRYNASDNETRSAIVLERTDELVERLETLEAEREALRERKDELHRGEYQARMAQFTVEIRALEREIDRTERRANETGVDTERLDRLRDDAANLSGPEVAEIARNLGGVADPPGQGPPDEKPGNGPHADGNETRGGGQGQGPGQDERSPGSGDRGSAGNANDSDSDRGPPDEADRSDRKSTEDADDDPNSDRDSTEDTDDSTSDRESTDDGSGSDSDSRSEQRSTDE